VTDIIAPLTPPNCDLRNFPSIMIHIPRLRSSRFSAIRDSNAWRAGFNLWMTSWHSVPAASLDAGDDELCNAAGLAHDIKAWRKVKETAMRGWVLCSDGRWYHKVVAATALEAWLEILGQRMSSGAGNAKRWGTQFDPEPTRTAIAVAATLLKALRPSSKAIQKVARHITGTYLGDIPKPSRTGPDVIPSGSQGKAKEIESREDSHSEFASIDDSNGSDALLSEFNPLFAAFPKQEQAKAALAAYKFARAKGVTASALLDGAQRYAVHVRASGEPMKFVMLLKNWLKASAGAINTTPAPRSRTKCQYGYTQVGAMRQQSWPLLLSLSTSTPISPKPS
jgi:hypothetical protein